VKKASRSSFSIFTALTDPRYSRHLSARTLAIRFLIFVLLPFASVWVIEQLVPLSILKTVVVFFPFDAHTVDRSVPGDPQLTIFAKAPWMYVFNGAYTALVAAITVAAGRRFPFAVNLGLYGGAALAGAALTHAILALLGFPFSTQPL